jgi:hypothetical protein
MGLITDRIHALFAVQGDHDDVIVLLVVDSSLATHALSSCGG